MTQALTGRRLVIVVAVVAAVTAVAAATAAALVLTGGRHKRAAPPPVTAPRPDPTTTTTTTTSTTTPPPAATTTTTTAPPTTTTTAGTPACAPADLAITTGPVSGGLSHEGFTLLFRNTGPSTCQVAGYPGITAVLVDGHRIPAQRSLRGYLGGLAPGASIGPVDLGPGAVASSLVESIDASSPGHACVQVGAYEVTPANTRVTSQLSPDGALTSFCGTLEVHPLVAGSTGSGGH